MELQDSLDELMPSAVPPDSSAGVQGDFRNQSDLYGGRIVEEEEEHGSLSLIVIICLLVCAAALCCICGDWIVRYSNRATSQSAELTGGSGNRDNSQACFLESDEDNGTPKVILTALETFMQDHPRSRRSQYWKENESGKTSSTEQGSMQRDGATSNEIPSNIGVLNGHFPKRISSPKPPPYRAFPESVQQKTRPRASIQEYQSLEIEQTAIMTPWSYVSEDIPRTPKPLSQLSPVKIQTVHKSHVPHHRPASTDLQQTPGDGPPRSPTPLSRAISEGNEKPPGPHPLRCSLDIQRPPRSPKPRSTEASEEIQRPPRPSSLRLSLELQRPPRSPTPPPRGASEEIQRPHVSFWIGDSSESQRSEPAAQEQFLVDPGGGVSSIVSSAEAHTSAPEPQRLPVELERGLRNFQLLPEHFVSTSNARQQNALSAVPE